MGRILIKFLKSSLLVAVFAGSLPGTLHGQSDSLWQLVAVKFNGLSKIIDGTDVLTLSGSFTHVNDVQSVLVTLDTADQILQSHVFNGWQIEQTLLWKGTQLYGGRGLWVNVFDSFINLLGNKDLVYGMCDLGDSLLLGGSFRNTNDSIIACMLVCDSAFNCHPLPFYDNKIVHIDRFVVYDSALIIAGNFNLWNGFKEIVQCKKGEWSSLDSGIVGVGDEWVDDMLVFHDTVFVAGRFFEQHGNKSSMIMRWDGKQWLQTGEQVTGVQVHDLHVFQDHLWASGIIYTADGKTVSNLLRWNGLKWDGVPTPYSGRIFRMGDFNNILYLSADFRDTLGSGPYSYLMKMRDTFTYLEHLITGGINKPSLQNPWTLFPNPAKNVVYLQSSESCVADRQIRIYNSLGERVSHEYHKLNEASTEMEVDISQLTEGIYWMIIIDGDSSYTKKFQILRY